MKEEIYKEILESPELQGKIMQTTGKSHQTVIRWAKKKDGRLNAIEILKVLKEHLKVENYAEFMDFVSK